MRTKSQSPSLWDPDRYEPFKSLHHEIDRVFESFAESMPWAAKTNGGNGFGPTTLQLNMSETEKAIEVTVELPGVDENDIDVTVTDDILTIKGEKRAEKEEKGKDYHVIERSHGAFQRSLTLPCEVKADKVNAKLTSGVLEITLPKSPAAKTKSHKVKIKSASKAS